jgi:hypothetical protein
MLIRGCSDVISERSERLAPELRRQLYDALQHSGTLLITVNTTRMNA